jgi:hypothetical protein
MKKIILLSLVAFTLLAGGCKKALDINSTRVVNEVNYWNTLEPEQLWPIIMAIGSMVM